MELALTSNVLIGCRLSPSQKADIVKLIKEYQPKKITLAIGDGINDVAMMKCANIAVSLKNNLHQSNIDGKNHALGCSDYGIG
jgi:P-type E1-E2 ATPase